jgi:hypothetical protein
MKTFGGWTGCWIVLFLFLSNELAGARGAGIYLVFPLGRLLIIPGACLVQMFCTFATSMKVTELVPAVISLVVLVYQFVGPPLRTLLTSARPGG